MLTNKEKFYKIEKEGLKVFPNRASLIEWLQRRNFFLHCAPPIDAPIEEILEEFENLKNGKHQ